VGGGDHMWRWRQPATGAGALMLTIVPPYQSSVYATSIFPQSYGGGGVRRARKRRMSIAKSCSSFDTSSHHTCCPCFANRYNNDDTNMKYRHRGINYSLAFTNHQQSRISTPPRIPYQSSATSTFINKHINNKAHHKANTQLQMSLIPIPVNELQDILPTPSKLTPSGDQYVTYLGRTPQQRFNSLFEGVSIAFLGSMFAYFISFVIGQFFATLLGIIFLFWPILSPEFKAYNRNWELVGGRDLVDVWMDEEDYNNGYYDLPPEDKRGLYGAYYVAQIEDVCVVDDVRASSEEEYDLEEFSGYTMATDELQSVTGLPWKLRLRLLDDEGRGMQVHSRMSEDYLDLQPGMNAVGVLLSTSKKFGKLAGMSDFCILDDVDGVAVSWVGDYPYLDKDMFLRTLNENGVTDSLLLDYDDNDDDVETERDTKIEDKGEADKGEEY